MNTFKMLFVSLLIFNLGFTQERFLSISFEEKKDRRSIGEVITINDTIHNKFYAFLEEGRKTVGYRFSENRELQSIIESDGLRRGYTEIIADAKDGNKILLLLKNNKGNKYGSIIFDFETKTTQEINYDIDKNDTYVESYSYNDQCIVFTFNKRDESVKKYRFTTDGNFTSKTIGLNPIKESLYKNRSKNTQLDYYFVPVFSSKSFKLNKINNRVPNNLELTTNLNKMYETKNGFIWTFDEDEAHTVLVKFTKPDFEPELEVIDKPKSTYNKYTSNSFIFGNHIALIISNSDFMKIEIKALDNPENIIKTLEVNKDDEIDFKNTPILQEGSTYSFGSTREMEKTSKFLRKISSQDNGISVFENDGHYDIIIGGTREQYYSSFNAFSGMGGVPVATTTPAGFQTMSFNPTYYAYNYYTNTGSTRIECLFDLEFNHIIGEIPSNVFDNIETYKDEIKAINAESINIYRDKILFGYFNKKERSYDFVAFDIK